MSGSVMKRRAGGTPSAGGGVTVAEVELVELRHHAGCWRAMQQPFSSQHITYVYDLDSAVDKLQLASDLWTVPFEGTLSALREANSELVNLLESQIVNQSKITDTLTSNKALLIDGVLMDVCRAQSQKKMPLLTAALGILGEANRISREYREWLSIYHKGMTPSEKWVADILVLARDLRPPASEFCLPGIAVATFDNLTMNINYKSYVVDGEGGQKLDMTNWFSTYIPKHLAPPAFDANAICEPLPCLSMRVWLLCARLPAH